MPFNHEDFWQNTKTFPSKISLSGFTRKKKFHWKVTFVKLLTIIRGFTLILRTENQNILNHRSNERVWFLMKVSYLTRKLFPHWQKLLGIYASVVRTLIRTHNFKVSWGGLALCPLPQPWSNLWRSMRWDCLEVLTHKKGGSLFTEVRRVKLHSREN